MQEKYIIAHLYKTIIKSINRVIIHKKNTESILKSLKKN